MGPTCVLSAPDGPHVGRVNLAIRIVVCPQEIIIVEPHSSCCDTIMTVSWSLINGSRWRKRGMTDSAKYHIDLCILRHYMKSYENHGVLGDNWNICSTSCSGKQQRKNHASALLVFCEGSIPVTNGFITQCASDGESVPRPWRQMAMGQITHTVCSGASTLCLFAVAIEWLSSP